MANVLKKDQRVDNLKEVNKCTISELLKCCGPSTSRMYTCKKRVHFNFALLHLQRVQVEYFHLWWPVWSKWEAACRPFLSISIHDQVFVDRHQGHMGCCPDALFEEIPFEMLIQIITCWGKPLYVCSLHWEHPHSDEVSIIFFIWLSSVESTNFFQQWRCLECSFDDHRKFFSSMRDGTLCMNCSCIALP